MEREHDIGSSESVELKMIIGRASGNFYQVFGNMIWC